MTFAQPSNAISSSLTNSDWDKIFDHLPPNAPESIVSSIFVEPLLEALGFSKQEQYRQFMTGQGNDAVDYAARSNTEDNFLHSRTNPFLLLEVKGKNINLADSTAANCSTKAQLTRYLLSLNCKSAQWGIITNSTYIQLFRRHGKIVVPATVNLQITRENIAKIITHIKSLITNTSKALSICVYNNKGGVGKTTTIVNLAAALWKHNKKVLLVDFDSQSDSTRSLKLQTGKVPLSKCLRETKIDFREAIVPFIVKDSRGRSAHPFDVIPADPDLEEYTHSDKAAQIERKIFRLRDLLKPLKNEYDYILIDCPTQWLFFSQSGVCAADVVLIPTKQNGLTSLHNAARVIRDFIPEIQQERNDGAPIALPIFFNGEKPTENSKQIANAEIQRIVTQNKNLEPYFCPKNPIGNTDKPIFHVPAYANVANAAFLHVPAVIMNKTVADYYAQLAKEYFLHG